MIIGSLPFTLYLQFIHKQKYSLIKDDQIKLFFIILIGIVCLTNFG